MLRHFSIDLSLLFDQLLSLLMIFSIDLVLLGFRFVFSESLVLVFVVQLDLFDELIVLGFELDFLCDKLGVELGLLGFLSEIEVLACLNLEVSEPFLSLLICS